MTRAKKNCRPRQIGAKKRSRSRHDFDRIGRELFLENVLENAAVDVTKGSVWGRGQKQVDLSTPAWRLAAIVNAHAVFLPKPIRVRLAEKGIQAVWRVLPFEDRQFMGFDHPARLAQHHSSRDGAGKGM